MQVGIDGRRGLFYGDDAPRVIHGFVDLQQLSVPTLQIGVVVHHLDPLTVGEAQKLVAAGVFDGDLLVPDVHILDTGGETPVVARPLESGCGQIAPSMHLDAVELVLQPFVSAARGDLAGTSRAGRLLCPRPQLARWWLSQLVERLLAFLTQTAQYLYGARRDLAQFLSLTLAQLR